MRAADDATLRAYHEFAAEGGVGRRIMADLEAEFCGGAFDPASDRVTCFRLGGEEVLKHILRRIDEADQPHRQPVMAKEMVHGEESNKYGGPGD